MSLTKFLRLAWRKPDVKLLRARMIEWRKDGLITKVEKPLRLDRARSLGYKAKKGVTVVRIKIKRGGHKGLDQTKHVEQRDFILERI